MFVLRAKAKLSDATADYALFGLAGNAIETLAAGAQPAWAKADFDAANVVFLYPGNDQPRALWCAPAGTPVPAGEALPLDQWQWLEVQSGIAMITQPIFEAFVPQMLNYESVGGVNFKKGCYPGQEIVARSQFRGTLKRRAYLAHTAGEPAVGQEVFHALDAEQPCGLVAACAPRPGGGFDAIVSMQTSAAADAEGGRLTLGSANGPALVLLPLPYALLEDI
jgi:folate-binding protein YgfZ